MKNSVKKQRKTSISLPLEGGGKVNFDNNYFCKRRDE
jgi:hypothetical protein